MVGNAVPVEFAKMLAAKILADIKKYKDENQEKESELRYLEHATM
jgi:hypothetical protein